LIGTPGGTGAGGVVNLLRSTSCDGGPQTCVELVHVTVDPEQPLPSLGTIVTLMPFFGTAGYGSYVPGSSDVIATAAAAGVSTITLTQFQPRVPGSSTGAPPIQVGLLGQFVRPLAFAECLRQALIVETNQDLNVIAAPMGGQPQTSAGTGHSGQGVYFEPYTSTVLTPFSQGGGYELTAFTLSGSAIAPQLTRRAAPSWQPPGDLRPAIVATRNPASFTCP
jgi:hypothetical protein